jgi:hypothetical protein
MSILDLSTASVTRRSHKVENIALQAQVKFHQLHHVTADIFNYRSILLFLSTAMLFLCLIMHTAANLCNM